MTAIAAMLSDRDRQRLADRLAEWRDTDREMRRPGLLAAPSEPTPLHLTRRNPAPPAVRDPRDTPAPPPYGPRGAGSIASTPGAQACPPDTREPL